MTLADGWQGRGAYLVTEAQTAGESSGCLLDPHCASITRIRWAREHHVVGTTLGLPPTGRTFSDQEDVNLGMTFALILHDSLPLHCHSVVSSREVIPPSSPVVVVVTFTLASTAWPFPPLSESGSPASALSPMSTASGETGEPAPTASASPAGPFWRDRQYSSAMPCSALHK